MHSLYILILFFPVFTRCSFPLLFPSIHCQNVKWRFEGCDNADCVCVCMCVLGVNSLCQSLSANPSIPSSLVHLDLSGNVLRGDDMQVRSHTHTHARTHARTHAHTHTHTHSF